MFFEPLWRKQVSRILESKAAFSRSNTPVLLHVVIGYLFMHAACAWQRVQPSQFARDVLKKLIKTIAGNAIWVSAIRYFL